jgi:peptide/nickel transport system substrate-binding protein
MRLCVSRLFLFCLSLAILLTLSACSPTEEEAVNPNRVVYGLTLSPSNFDPHRGESSELGIPMRQVYDTLVYRHPENGRFVPGLAELPTISEDRMTYTFTLKQGVKFHDGTPFNAEAVGANLDRIMAPETQSTKARMLLGPYQGYTINDEYSISIQLSEPYSPLLDTLSQVYLGIASPTALAQYRATPETYQFHQVGTGPYMLDSLLLDNYLILKRNPDYTWGPEFYQPASGQSVAEIEYRFYSDTATRFEKLEQGLVQVMGEIPPLTARAQTGNSRIRIIPSPIPGQPLQFMINTQRFPTDNRVFRQALLSGTNREAVVDLVFQGFSPVAYGPITSNTQFYNPNVRNYYPYDLAQAQQLVASLGYVDDDNDNLLDLPDGSTVSVDVLVPPWGMIPQVAQALQSQWGDLQIQVNLIPVPDLSTLLNRVQEGEYNLVAFYSFGIDPALLQSFFTTNGAHNWTGFSSPELDQILAEGSRQLDPGTRGRLYAQAQEIIMDNALILPIREYVNLNGVSNQVQNLTFDSYGWFPLMANTALAASADPAAGSDG